MERKIKSGKNKVVVEDIDTNSVRKYVFSKEVFNQDKIDELIKKRKFKEKSGYCICSGESSK